MSKKPPDILPPSPVIPPDATDGLPLPPTRWFSTRREVLKAGAATTGALLYGGLNPSLRAAMSGAQEVPVQKRRGITLEKRDLLFNFSRLQTESADLILVAGSQRVKLQPTPAGVLKRLRREHPVLERVPDSDATHYVNIRLPAEAIQLCYVQRVRKGGSPVHDPKATCKTCATPGDPWDLLLQFMHVPAAALRAAADRIASQLGIGESVPVSGKWLRYGLTGDDVAALDDPVGLDMLKDSNDTAATIVGLHPEMISGDPTSYSYVQQQIIGPQSQTTQLADVIDAQGPITPQENWSGCGSPIVPNASGYGTNVPLCNPDTGTQAVNSAGQLQYTPVYSSFTNQAAQSAITPALQSVKADATLGANDTQDPDEADGIIYRYADGVPTSDQTADGLGAGSGLSYTTKDYSPGQGFSVTVLSVDPPPTNSPDLTALVTVQVSNWYVRTLGLFVQYLDAKGNTLPTSQLDDEVLPALQNQFPLQNADGQRWNTEDSYFLDTLPPEKEYLGIPTGTPVKTLQIPVPESAVSFQILASGMGNTPSGSNPDNATTVPGATMTGLFNLSLPTLFLALNAAAGAGKMSNALSSGGNAIISIFELAMDLFAESFEAISFDDPAAFEGLAKAVGEKLFSSNATDLVNFVVTYLTEGETQEDLLDAVPVIGGFMAMVYAMGTVATIAESSTQVLQSPSTYRFQVSLTHDIDVVITGDPINAGIWPSEATNYKVILQFDGGTPTTLEQNVPAQTVDSQTASFAAVPLGGLVTASVQVYSADGYQLAQASAGSFINDNPDPDNPLQLPLQLTQSLVPLTAGTVYSHKEVTALDASGNHVWNPTASAPVQEASGCNPTSGQLCQLTGITINTTAGAVGQSFESANDAVVSCVSGAGGQLHQFANTSVTADPESGYFATSCGFTAPPRVAYDVVNNPDFNFYLDTETTGTGFLGGVIRQIRLGANPTVDLPDSNLAWGKLQFPSNAFLLHPGGKIVSVNSTHSKIEVVTLPSAAVPDAQAPISQAYGGRGLREGLMDGPTLAALAPDGTVLVLEANNSRIQAFDLSANPSQRFGTASADYYFPLKVQEVTEYLDFSVEFKGYMYVLWVNRQSATPVYTLDIYDPSGNWLTSTPGFDATRMTVSYFRDVYTQNFQVLTLPDGSLPARTEPSISHWIPSTPAP
jgi:hypothetical protein